MWMQVALFVWVVLGELNFFTLLSLSDTETVDNSSIYLFFKTELEFEEPPSTNGDVADIRLMMDDYLRGDVSPILECSCFSLLSLCETYMTCSLHLEPLK